MGLVVALIPPIRHEVLITPSPVQIQLDLLLFGQPCPLMKIVLPLDGRLEFQIIGVIFDLQKPSVHISPHPELRGAPFVDVSMRNKDSGLFDVWIRVGQIAPKFDSRANIGTIRVLNLVVLGGVVR